MTKFKKYVKKYCKNNFFSVIIYDDDDNENLCIYIHFPDNLFSFSIEKHQ